MAARNIAQIVDLMRFIVRKALGQYVTIEEATATLDSTQLDVFEKYFKLFETEQQIHDALRPFRVTESFSTTPSGYQNYVTFPTDYMHFVGDAQTVYGSTLYKIKFVNDDEWADATRSQLRAPSTTQAIAKDVAGGFNLCPFVTLIGQYNYLRRPTTPVYAYTISGRTITYNEAGSTQLEWQDNYINEIMFGALSYWGINMSDEGIIQYSEMQKQETSDNGGN